MSRGFVSDMVHCPQVTALTTGFLLFVGPLGVLAAAEGDRDARLFRPPLRLANGEPLTCIYFFGHWWEPWKSDDEAIRRDLKRLRELGFNTLLLDHEFSQMLDGNWKWVDREHRLAKEMGFGIIPWLEAHCGRDVAVGNRRDAAERMFGLPQIPLTETQDGQPGQALITSEGFKQYLTAYVCAYVARYLKEGALLQVLRDGRPRPVISLSCEMDFTAFDPDTNQRFVTWLRRKYRDVAKLNAAWKADFVRFEDANPKDKQVFDYSHADATTQSAAVLDHVAFRSQLCNEVFAEIKARVRRKYPDLLFLAEVPYQFEGAHPHARSYKITCACTPETVRFADLLLVRWTQGRPSPEERTALAKYVHETGAQVVICYRVSKLLTGEFGSDTAEVANGLGYYSWNEMVDCHAVENPTAVGIDAFRIDAATSADLVQRLRDANVVWRRIHER